MKLIFVFLSGAILAIAQSGSGVVNFRPNLPGIANGRTVENKLTENMSVKDFGAKCDNSTDDAGRFSIAQTTLSSGVLQVRGGRCVIGTDFISAAGVVLNFDPGSSLSVGAGKTLVLSAAPQAGPHRIFYGSGLVKFARNVPIQQVLPEWFGAIADYDDVGGTGTDNTAAIQRMLASVINVGGGVSAATWSAGTASYTTAGLHLLRTGDRIMIGGVSPSGFNAPTCNVTVTGTKTFTCGVASNPGAYSSGGTLRDVFPGENRAGSTPFPPFVFGAGAYLITSGLGADLVDAQYVTLQGTGESSRLICKPASANTDCLPFTSSNSAYLRYGNMLRDIAIVSVSTNVRKLVSFSVQNQTRIENVTLAAFPVGAHSGNLLYMEGMQTSSVDVLHVTGAGASGVAAVKIGASPTSTTVAFNAVNVEGSGGECMDLGGAVGAAGISVSNSTVEGCTEGIKVSTEVHLRDIHYEANSVHALHVASSGLAVDDASNYQQCSVYAGTTMVKVDSGATVTVNDPRSDLGAGCAFFDVDSGGYAYSSGPILPESTYPSGYINIGDASRLSAGVLAKHGYVITGVGPGDYTLQPFRGNMWEISVVGDTVLHVEGGSTGAVTPMGISVGEEITVFLTTNGSKVETGNGNTGDIEIEGSINDSGRAASTYQVIKLRMQASGKLKVVDSPGWHSTSVGTSFRRGDFSSASVNNSAGSCYRWLSASWALWLGQTSDDNAVRMGSGACGAGEFAFMSPTLFRVRNTAASGSTLLRAQAGSSQSGNIIDVLDNAGTEIFGVTSSGVSVFGASVGNVVRSGSLVSGQLVSGAGTSSVQASDLTGDVTTSGSVATTLASVGSAGSCGSATTTCGLTFDAKGRETARADTTIALPGSAITSGTVANARLVGSGALTVTAGAGMSGGGSVDLGSSVTLTNAAPFPSGGVTGTKTVRDSAGTGTCTLVFTDGLLTGGTC